MEPFIITFISGISTLFGIIPTYINSKYKEYIIKFSLLFSSFAMIYVSIFSLVPEAINYIGISFKNIIFLIILIGIGIIISKYVDTSLNSISSNSLYKLGLINLLVLILHNIPEGIITFLTSSNDIKLGITIAIAITLHNIPEGISIAIPIYYSTNNRKLAFIYTFISGFSELFGGIISYIFLNKFINNNNTLFIILSITSGIMLYLALFELLPNALKKEDYSSSL